MTPLDQIRHWLVIIDGNAHEQIAFFVLAYSVENVDAYSGNVVAKLDTWLTPRSTFPPFVFGRALVFRNLVETLFTGSFLGRSWVSKKAFCDTIIEIGRADPTSREARLVPYAERFLPRFLGEVDMWKDVGVQWEELVSSTLSTKRLDDWIVSAREAAVSHANAPR